MAIPEWVICFPRMRWLVGAASVVASVGFLVCAVFVAYVTYDQTRRWTPEKVEQATREALPPGSTRAEVVAFLEGKGFPYRSWLKYEDFAPGHPPHWFGEAIG